MTDSKKTGELLERAYALKEDKHQMLELYQDWAESYDHSLLDHLGYRSPAHIARLAAAYLPTPGARVLDIGCGTGLGGLFLSAKGFERIWGLDFSLPMLREALSKHCYRGVFLADLNKTLPFRNNVFDAITCLGTFTHSHVGAGCIPALLQSLVAGGFFICSVHHDVWETGGFEETESTLLNDGRAAIVYKQSHRLFESDPEANAWFVVWQLIGT